ncbi:PEP-CTERM sorting domain-containing protein [Roseateles sp. P5_D6]
MTFSTKLLAVALTTVIGLGAGAAHAGLVAHADVNGYATFQDTTTGRVWLQLPDLFNMNYTAQVNTATAAGFSVASLSDVDALWTSTPGSDWNALSSVIGGSSSRGLMWGNYADVGASNPNAYAYAYAGTNGSWDHYNPNNTSAYSDLGLWAYQTGAAALPEPASYALVGIALAGVGLAKRRRKA